MKLILAIIYLILGLSKPYKGFKGEYYISGKAYLNETILLPNEKINVEFGNEVLNIMTDKNGNYSIRIPIEWPCPTAIHEDLITKEQILQITKSFNPRYIFFEYKQKCVDIENYFYKTWDTRISRVTFHEDLKFK